MHLNGLKIERLWNEVDKVEKHNAKTNNPRLAKEILLSLPNDFDREVQTELTKDFIKSEFVDKGMVAIFRFIEMI